VKADGISNVTAGWTTGVRLPAESVIFLLATTSRPAHGASQPPAQSISGVLSQEIRRPEREPNTHLHPVPSLRLCGSLPPHHLHVCVAWWLGTGEN